MGDAAARWRSALYDLTAGLGFGKFDFPLFR
jgi:hypothetical protein